MNKKRNIILFSGRKTYSLDSLFDQGSLSSYEIISTDPLSIRLDPVNHWNSVWAHYAIRDNTFGGKTPKFYIAHADHYAFGVDQRMCVWSTSPDTDTWYDFDNVADTGTELEFYNDTAFPSGIIYISALPLYPFSRVQRIVAEWLANSLISDTASGTNGVIFNTTSRNADDGSNRIVPALPFYGFNISNGEGTKNKILLTAYTHPSETPGPFALEGALDWLLSNDTVANFLLDYCDFTVYPCVNPQGVWSGYFRSCPEDKTLDPNRKFFDGTSGVLEIVDGLKTAITSDMGDVDVMVDYHSYMDNVLGFGNVIDEADATHIAFMNAVKIFYPTFYLSTSAVSDGLKDYINDTYASTIEVVPEFGHSFLADLSSWKLYGKYILQGLARFLAEGRLPQSPAVGSRDFNGSTDRIDWANVYNPAGGAMSISFWVKPDAVTANQYMICLGKADNTSGILVSLNTVPALQFLRTGSTSLSRYGTNLTQDVWQSVIITHTGIYDDYTTIKIYVNGTEISYINGTNGNTETAITGLWALGGRPSADDRNFNGKLAQVGVWNRVLTSTEIVNLAFGYAPSLAAPSDLKFYFSGATDSLANSVTGGADGTADGTTHIAGVGNGAPIVY